MNGPGPLVSVVIAAFNGGPLLRATVDSLRSQTEQRWEAVVIDDAGDDDLRWVDDLDPRLRVVRLDRNSGVSVARNIGVEASRAPLIAFCDQDDLWAPEKLEVQLSRLRDDDVLSHTAFDLIDNDGARLSDGYGCLGTYDAMASGHLGVLLSSAVVPRSVFLRCGGFSPLYRMQQDLELFMRLAPQGSVNYSPEPLVHYRRHPGQGSRDYWRAFREIELIWRTHELDHRGTTRQRQLAEGLVGIRRTYSLQAVDEARASLTRGDARNALAHAQLAARISPSVAARAIALTARRRLLTRKPG